MAVGVSRENRVEREEEVEKIEREGEREKKKRCWYGVFVVCWL